MSAVILEGLGWGLGFMLGASIVIGLILLVGYLYISKYEPKEDEDTIRRLMSEYLQQAVDNEDFTEAIKITKMLETNNLDTSAYAIHTYIKYTEPTYNDFVGKVSIDKKLVRID